MRTKVLFFGVICCFVIAAGAGLIHMNRRWDQASYDYVKKNIPVIFERWNSAVLIDQASPELLKINPGDKIETLFVHYAERYGDLRLMHRPVGRARMRIRLSGPVIMAEYTVKVSYQKTDAVIRVLVRLLHKKWRIAGFHIIPVKQAQ